MPQFLSFLIMMHRFFVPRSRLRWVALSSLSILQAGVAAAQVPPPPLPPPPGDEEEVEDTEDSSDAGQDAAPNEVPEPSTEQAPSIGETEPAPVLTTGNDDVILEDRTSAEMSVTAGAAAEPGATNMTQDSAEQWRRKWTSRRQTTVNGSTGVHRVREAGSGPAGTFRINFVGSYFAGNGFLCRESSPCLDEFGQDQGEDNARRQTYAGMISVTPFSFLEAYVSLFNSATSNSNGSPSALLVVGDTSFGLKGFLPDKLDRIYSFGADLEVGLLAGTGGINVASGGANFALRALGTLDLNNRTDESKRIPIRAHLNLGYQFDNSWRIVEDLESTLPPAGRGAPVERTERYGFGISRVDSFEIGLAAEYVHAYVRPFLEYTVDVPVNRQNYVCNRQGAASRGDQCLGDAQKWGTSPNRLSFGANVFPWQATGLSIKAAMDIGTGGKKQFLEETTPESPWALWLGLGYVVDTVPPPPRTITVAEPTLGAPEPRRYVLGVVVDEKEGAPIPAAVIRYQDVPMTGLVASSGGEFISQDLPPGDYGFKISADGFEEGTCSVSIPVDAPEMASAASTPETQPAEVGVESEEGASDTASASRAESSDPYMDADGNLLVPVTCKLKELPQIATITGLLVDSDTGGPVADATVTITDNKNRSLTLEVDELGSFQFRNVPFGAARLHANAPGYLPTVAPILIDSRGELTPHLVMNTRPETLGVTLRAGEVRVDKPLKFVGESTELTIKSMAMLEEVAVFLAEHPDAGNVEIQVHTDDSGAASYSRRLSQQRADRLMEILVQLGVEDGRLTAKGYGPDQPLAPNVNDANRDKNNRVQLVIVNE